MAYVGNSRPASGSEHHLSHFFEIVGVLRREKYLPHGVDAAVGNKTQNLRWRNDYDFPIRVEAHTSGDGALCMLIYRVYDEK